MIRRLFLFCLFLLPISGVSQGETPLPMDPRVTQETLPSGLKVYYRHAEKPENRVNIRLVFRVGSLYEEKGEEGLAHFLEHLAFHGGPNFKVDEMEKWLRAIGAPMGGDSNASTGWTRTNYYLRLKTEDSEVKKGLQFFQDILTTPTFPQDRIDLERGVVLEEKRLRRDMNTRWWEKFTKLTLKGTMYPERFPIGLSESLQKVNREQFVNFHKRLYHPEVAFVVIVGDMPLEKMRALVKETLAKVPKPSKAKPILPISVVKPNTAPRAELIDDPEITKSSFSLVWVKPQGPIRTIEAMKKYAEETLAMNILEERLKRLAMGKNAPFAEPGTWLGAWMKDVKFVSIGADSKKLGQEVEAGKAIIEELDRVLTHGILQEELDEQLLSMEEQLKQAVVGANTKTADTIAYELENSIEDEANPVSEQQALDLYLKGKSAITLKEVNGVIRALLGDPNPLILVEYPEKEKKRFTSGPWLKLWQDTLKKTPVAYSLPKLVKKVDYSKLKPGKIVKREEIESLKTTKIQLDNGIVLFLKKTEFDNDWFNVRAKFDVSMLDFPAHLWGIQGFLAAGRRAGGTAEFTANDISRLLKGKAFSFSFSEDGYGGGGNPKYEEEMYQWLHDHLTRPAFREETLKALRTSLADAVMQARLDQETAFERAAATASCPGPLSWANDDPSYFDRFTTQVLKAHHAQVYPTEASSISIVGDIDIEKSIKLAQKYLGSLPRVPKGKTPDALKTCVMEEGETRRAIFKGKEDRTMVKIVMPNAGFSEIWDLAALAAGSSVMTLRLKDRLREELGQAYYASVTCSLDLVIEPNSRCAIEFTVPFNQVKRAIDETQALITKFAKEGPSQKELDEIKLARRKNHDEQLKANSFWINLNLDAAGFRKVSPDFWILHRRRVQKVTPQQIKDAVKKYWLTGQKVTVVATGEMNQPKADK